MKENDCVVSFRTTNAVRDSLRRIHEVLGVPIPVVLRYLAARACAELDPYYDGPMPDWAFGAAAAEEQPRFFSDECRSAVRDALSSAGGSQPGVPAAPAE